MSDINMQDKIDALTHKWCADIRGTDVRLGIGAGMNVLTTIGNYSPPEVRSTMAMFLRKMADELEAKRHQ